MTTSFSAARLRAAATIAERYAAQTGVTAVLCAGSTGRGHADRWSDVELGVFCTAPPSDEARTRPVEEAGGAGLRKFGYDPDERSYNDEWWYEGPAGAGLLVEVVHLTHDGTDWLLDQLLEAADPSEHLLALASALAYGRPLHGSVSRWADRVTTYPRPLAAAVVRRHGQIDNFWRWQMYVERGNRHGLRIHWAGVAAALTHIACALNGRWWPGTKWPAWTLSDLPITPTRLAERLAGVDDLLPADAAKALAALVEETYDLVETHLPEADPDRLRAIFHFTRSPWP